MSVGDSAVECRLADLRQAGSLQAGDPDGQEAAATQQDRPAGCVENTQVASLNWR